MVAWRKSDNLEPLELQLFHLPSHFRMLWGFDVSIILFKVKYSNTKFTIHCQIFVRFAVNKVLLSANFQISNLNFNIAWKFLTPETVWVYLLSYLLRYGQSDTAKMCVLGTLVKPFYISFRLLNMNSLSFETNEDFYLCSYYIYMYLGVSRTHFYLYKLIYAFHANFQVIFKPNEINYFV